jgi:hypothetical protein
MFFNVWSLWHRYLVQQNAVDSGFSSAGVSCLPPAFSLLAVVVILGVGPIKA